MRLKKIKFRYILLLIVSGLIINWLLIPRSLKKMERIASGEVVLDFHWNEYEPLLTGPKIEEIGDNYVSFYWVHNLEWGDSAVVFVQVWKSIYSTTWRNYIWPSTTMNYQWTYLELNMGGHRMGNFVDLVGYDKSIKKSEYVINPNQRETLDSSELLLSPDRLQFFLKQGYFEILSKNENNTIVAFHEPIGKMRIETQLSMDTNITSGALIFLNDSNQISIRPIRIPAELWNR